MKLWFVNDFTLKQPKIKKKKKKKKPLSKNRLRSIKGNPKKKKSTRNESPGFLFAMEHNQCSFFTNKTDLVPMFAF
jgi:hypothetical protein